MTDLVPAVRPSVRERNFPLTVMGRTLEHLGTQMYKRRDAAIAELVANAWDAGATNVSVYVGDTASYDPTHTAVEVTDDGQGFDVDATRATANGFGLRGMQTRLEQVGGAVDVQSAVGRGTTVTVTLP